MKIQEHTIAKAFLQACDFVINTGQGLADHIACFLLGDQHTLTRYANNQIIQNVRKQDHTMIVKVILSGRIGMASCNQLDEQTLYRTVKQAVELAKFAPIHPAVAGFPEQEIIPQVNGCDEATEQVTATEMARMVEVIISKSASNHLRAAGAVQVQVMDQAVANSSGVRVYGRRTKAEVHAVVLGKTGSGYASDTKRSFYDLQAEEVARVAIEKCQLSEGAIELPAGDYPVILEQKATAELLSYLGVLAFNPVTYHQGNGFLSNRMGYRVLSEQLSISEDPLGKEGLPDGFDWDGLPKQKVSLIQDGVATGMVYDDATGKKYGCKSTGNARYPLSPSYVEICPSHLHMEAGKTSRADMIAQMDRGILITRFHYVGVLHSKEILLTGMTRGGTFYIENGKIVSPVKNLRFTEKISSAFNQVIAVGDESKLHSWPGSMSTVKAPDLMLSTFHFNGAASH
ncbi:putative Zn-dependent protease [Croceifilum oryzae]|uniref:Zn-dependent protease n=1 Tax=Croceifilum oryzae TaxID=1553429 RepID=A0AAJ1TGC2_9BACL|nr:TldD/PmbA family protein [Croceifilum oryzae]MDQ0417984.1 putative Zn-dependent protease [Croceifilum oryzae]